MVIQKAIAEYLEWKGSYAPAAAKAYGTCLNKFSVERSNLEEISQLDVVRFIESQSSKLKTITVVWYVNILKDFFGYYRCKVNPKLIRRPKFTAEPRQYVTEEEFAKMNGVLNEWEFYQLQKKVAINLLWHTGIRVSELCDIDLLDIENSKNSAKIVTKKNKQYRYIMWSGDAHQLLMRYIGTKICLNQNPALFSGREGRITRRTIERWVKDTSKKAGIERRVHPHMFRHGKAHKMLRNGADLNDVKTILGHRTIVSTQAYTGLFPEEFERMASKYV
jgi:site-specific recombinase XerD